MHMSRRWASGGYSYSAHGYIDNLPADTSQHGYSIGLEYWAGNLIQWGFMMNIANIYHYEGTDSAYNDLNLYLVQLMFAFRLRLIKGFYLGGAVGYQLGLIKPEINGSEVPELGDDGLQAMVLAGYDFNVTRKIIVSPGFRILWGFEQDHVFTSYMPGISVAYKF